MSIKCCLLFIITGKYMMMVLFGQIEDQNHDRLFDVYCRLENRPINIKFIKGNNT